MTSENYLVKVKKSKTPNHCLTRSVTGVTGQVSDLKSISLLLATNTNCAYCCVVLFFSFSVVTSSMGYCYGHVSCSGPKAPGMSGMLVGQDECCNQTRSSMSFGWGLSGAKCQPCLTGATYVSRFQLDKPFSTLRLA